MCNNIPDTRDVIENEALFREWRLKRHDRLSQENGR